MEHAGCSMLEFPAQVRDEAGVLFEEGEAGVGDLEKLREGAEAGADLDDVVAGLDIEERHDRSCEILIVQKILAEAAGGGGLQVRQCPLDFTQGHRGVGSLFHGRSQSRCEQARGRGGISSQVIHNFPP